MLHPAGLPPPAAPLTCTTCKVTTGARPATATLCHTRAPAPELDVHVAHHVVSQVVAHVEVLHLPKLGQLQEDVLVEVLWERERGGALSEGEECVFGWR